MNSLRYAALLAFALSVCPPYVIGWCAETGKNVQPKRQSWDELMTVDLNAPVEELAPVPDAEARRKAFAERNSPENIERLAKELFNLWDFGEGRTSRNPMTQRLETEKALAAKLFKEKKYDDCLKAFRTYFIHKAEILWNTKPSFVTGNFDGRLSPPLMKKRYGDFVSLLMQNTYQTATTKATFRLGEPGLVHWEWKSKETQNIWDNLKKPEIEYLCGSEFDKLWWKFVDTKDRQYLDKWAMFLDDYCLNHHLQEDLNSLNLDLGKQGAWEAMGFFHALTEISRAVPEGDETLPAPVLARMLLRQLTIIVPQSLYYNRQQSNNHSPGTVGALMRVSEFIFDFNLARTIETEGRRQFENYGTLEARPDGAGPGRLPGYAMFEFKENQSFLEKFRLEDFDWYTPQLNREYRDRLLLRARYMINMYSASGEQIVTHKTDRHTNGFDEMVTYFNRYLPELFDEPAISKIANRIIKNQTQPAWNGRVFVTKGKPIASMGMGSAADDEPEYTSYSYPFDRVHVMSSGWNPKNDQYGVLLGSTVRGYGDSFMKENKACNHFNISAFDRDLFTNGIDYAYNYLSSPVLVDGQQQFNGAGEGPTARRGSGNYGLDPICQDRIHYSADFDIAEGFYDGAYATTGGHDPEYYAPETKLEALKRSLWGVSHRRVVQFVKKHGLWVVTDLMKSEKPREYAQQWWLCEHSKEFPDGFLTEQIETSNEKQFIKSKIENKVNFSMYHFGPSDLDKPGAKIALQYDPVQLKTEEEDKFKGVRMDRLAGREFIQLRGSWKSQGGRSQVVTVIYPRKALDDDIVSLLPLKREDGQVNGFVATLKDGAEVGYIASMENPEALNTQALADALHASNTPVVAEALLVVKETDGRINGTILGCTEIKSKNPASADFEFTSLDHSFETTPINRPIQPVVIEPERNVFVDQIEVTMKTATEGTEIHYTIDGSDPVLSSRLYSGPLTFTSSVMLKTRAFRKGLSKMPPMTPTGTEMSGVNYAVFTQEEYHAPNTWTKNPKSGLNYEYYEAKWPFLLFGPNKTLAPMKRGQVPALFDTTPKGDNKDRAFAFVYDGYLDVPEDGVYTVYAPKEYTNYRPLAGYDLNLSLGYQNNYNEGKLQKLSGGSPRNTWYTATRRHAFGTWTIALKKGLQPIRIYYADIRPGGRLQYLMNDYPSWNVPGLTKIIWDGDVPQLEISGPGINRQPIPKEWLKRE